MPKCLNWRNILSWIPFGSDLDPTSDNVFFFFYKGERIQISLKAVHHRPASETPLNGPTLNAGLEFQGIRPSIAKKFYIFVIFQGVVRTFCPLPLNPRMGPDNVYTYWDILKTYFIVRIGFCTTLHTFYRMHKFLNWRNILYWIPFGLIWIQTVFANVNSERKRETGTCTSFRENQRASTYRQVEREERGRCVFFLNFVIFFYLRISKFRVYICKKFWSTRCITL